jgi:hypothetical protein
MIPGLKKQGIFNFNCNAALKSEQSGGRETGVPQAMVFPNGL